MKKIIVGSIVASSVLMASGYRIPEASLNAVALSAANIAHVKTADAAYYNPANMVFMSDENHLEADLKYIGLDAANYKGTAKNSRWLVDEDISSEKETFLVPSIHYVSGNVNGARYGVSIVSPGGLSKRWEDSVATYSAKEFTLELVEINPTVALPIGDKIGVAIGLRILHSKGIVKSDSPIASRDMSGDSIDFGYNLALSYKPTSALEFGLTYRSQVDLTTEGDAELSVSTSAAVGPYPAGTYASDSSASLTVPLPAILALAGAYTFSTNTTVEFVYERTYWSAYEELNFNYGSKAHAITNAVFGKPIKKHWNDSNDYRLGVTQELSSMTLMAGAVYSETPIPEEDVTFDLPDSNSLSVSFGGRYHLNEKIDLGMSALYSMRESRTVENDDLKGEFSGSNILIVSMGVGYKF